MSNWSNPKNDYTIGDEVTPDIFNELAENERYLKEKQDTKITTTDVKEANIISSEYSTRTNILATEKLKIGFGKIRKWLSDLGTLAFRNTITESYITGTISASKIAGLSSVATSGSYNDLSNKPTLGTLASRNSITESFISGYISSSKISGLASVATSGSYNSLINRPTLGALAARDNITESYISGSISASKISGAVALSSASEMLKELDTRSVNSSPQTYMSGGSGQKLEFKYNSVIGLASAGTYSQIWTIVPWGDGSGGYPVQVAFNSYGMFKRYGTSTSAWSTWYKLLTADELGQANGLATLNSSSKLNQYVDASHIIISSNSGTGSTTNLQTALTYIANVFKGTQTVTKIKANTLDVI